MDDPMHSDHASETGSPAQQPRKPLACTNCRARKLGCSRQHPCQHCTRSGTECVFPARRRVQKPRKTKNTELIQRLNRLESIVGKVGVDELEQAAGIQPAPTTPASSLPASHGPQVHHGGPRIWPHFQDQRQKDEDNAQKQVDATSLRYISGTFWSNLCGEVEGLKQALAQKDESESDSSEDESPSANLSPAYYDVPASLGLIGPPASPLMPGFQHPHPDQIRFLASAYVENVDYMIKIIHRPTVIGGLLQLADSGCDRTQLSPAREALFFSIYYAAVTSLDDDACRTHLGQDREQSARGFRLAMEHALARADYLNSSNIEALQALTILCACLRAHTGARMSWVLLSTPIRIAQAINLHRDGNGERFSFYQAEMRRRLWWHLMILDIRGAEDRGTDAMILTNSYNTRLPLNINDDDFGPDTVEPPEEHGGSTEVTFTLCIAQCAGIYLHVGFSPYTTGEFQNEEETIKYAKHLEAQFVTRADPTHPASYAASFIVRIIILKMWLVSQYPVHGRAPQMAPPVTSRPTGVSRDATLRTALSILELTEHSRKGGPHRTAVDNYSWWSDTWVQWHPLAVTLAELCTQTRGQLVDRAWDVVERVTPFWATQVADSRNGALWRPIRKLYKKAQTARQRAEQGAGTTETPVTPTAQSTLTPASAASAPVGRPHPLGGLGRGESPASTMSGPMYGTPDSNRRPVAAAAPVAAPLQASMGFPVPPTNPSTMPVDFNRLSMAAPQGFFNEFAWPEINFDVPVDPGPNQNMQGTGTVDWATWSEFMRDAWGAHGGGRGDGGMSSRQGSSEGDTQ